MFCCQCHNDLADCTCPDLKERLEKLGQCQHFHIGADYKKRLEAQAKKTEHQKTEAE